MEEDDVWDIRDYFNTHFKDNITAISLEDSSFWDICGENIANIPSDNWHRVFEIIWGGNESINDTFITLVDELKELNFVSVLFTKFETVLREYGTLMHVARLRELYEQTEEGGGFKPMASVFFQGEHGDQFTDVKKSILCALTAELVFKVRDELKPNKPFLNTSDLLDFPGARSRLKNDENSLNSSHMGEMVLRGKVSYIFNKYSAQFLISNLLFCNSNAQRTVTYIPELLNNWISQSIGKNSEEREIFLRDALCPPLFVIYTFFNEDLKYNSTNDRKDNLEQKWIQRFVTIFENEFVTSNFDWLTNWTDSEPNFKNSYMLRDYLYSDTIYSGYRDDKVEKELILDPKKIPGYFDKLKTSFVGFDFVKNHFFDPELSWNEAATINKDGSALIINNLSKISNNLARTKKFIRDLNRMSKSLHTEMAKHYHSDESDEQIRKADLNAREIYRTMDVVFGRHPLAFGQFIRRLSIQESHVYNLYKETLQDPSLNNKQNINVYILIRKTVTGLSENKEYEENMVELIRYTGLPNAVEVEEYYAKKGVDLNELFYGDMNRLKSASEILAENLKKKWFEEYLNKERFADFIEKGFDASVLDKLFSNMRISFNSLGVEEMIAQEIREYVDMYFQQEDAVEMIADISAGMINKFVNSIGWDYYSGERISQIKKAEESTSLELKYDFDRGENEYIDNEQLAELFDNMHNYEDIISQVAVDRGVVKKFPNIWNIDRWSELMRVSFIANCDIPNYDPMANKALGKVLETIASYQFDIN